jgi:hypothetical protein
LVVRTAWHGGLFRYRGTEEAHKTMISIDGIFIIFEGIHRLRWKPHHEWSLPTASTVPTRPHSRVIEHVWPDQDSRRRIQRQIEHGQRVVVVFDEKPPKITLASEQVPRVPAGSVLSEEPQDGVCSLFIPPLNWLRPAERGRGEAFVGQSSMIVSGTSHDSLPRLLVEDSLVGTAQPLRFVYQTRPLTIDVLRNTMSRLYTPAPPGRSAVPRERLVA